MKRIFKLFIVTLFYLSPIVSCFAQNFELKIHEQGTENTSFLNALVFERFHKSKQSILEEVSLVSEKLKSNGYIYNEYHLTEKDSVFDCEFILNQKIKLLRIYYKENTLPKSLLETVALNYSDTFFEIALSNTEATLTTIVAHFENQGYSFATVFLSDISQDESKLSATLNLKISEKRTIDHIVIRGYDEFPKKYLKHYLNIKPSTTFNLESLNRLNDLVNTIPFVSQIKKPEVLFTKDSTALYLYLKKKSNSNFDGIIGFSNEEGSKLRFNGFLDLELNNILNKGESFSIHWENNQKKNSTLNLGFSSPYIFNSKLNIKGNFSIFRQDSLFVTTNGLVELGYTINQNNSIQLTGISEKSNLSNSNSAYDIEDFNKLFLGISYTFNIIENPLYINRYKFFINAGYFLGNRKTTEEKTSQQGFQFDISYTAHLNTRNAIFIKTKSQFLNATNLFENELFRIGGVNSIRGFDQNSILTSKYNVTNLEYQYSVNVKSYIYTITDFAILNNLNTNTATQLYGLGLGYYLNTKNVILDLSYALGKNYSIPFNFNNSKIHIKITYPF